ncbi:hypothetical protein M405DRAFT_829613, partial [Rhizopogon salebrosus TDB-379]
MRGQVQEYKGVNSIGWVGLIRYGNAKVVEIVPSDKDVSRPSMDTSPFQHWGEKAPVGSIFLLQLAGEALLGFTTANRMPILLNLLCTFLIIIN